MKKVFKIVSLLLAVTMMMTVFSGCGGDADDESSKASGTQSSKIALPDIEREITSDAQNSAEEVGFEKKSLKNPNITLFLPYEAGDMVKEQIAAYEKRYNAKVKIETCLWDSRMTRLATLIQSGESPDVVSVVYSDAPKMIVRGLLDPIDGLTDMNNPIYDKSSNDGIYSMNGKHYALTTKAIPYGIYYNASMFKRNGVKAPIEYYKEGTWNWDNFRKTALDMSEDTDNDGVNDIFGFATWRDDIFVVSNGTDMIKMEGGKPCLNITDAKVTKGLQFFQDMFYKDHSIQIAHWESAEGFRNKKVAMVFEGFSYQMQLLYEEGFKDEIGVVPFPMGPDAKKTVHYTANTAFGIGKDSKNKDAAAAFIEEYMTKSYQNTMLGKTTSFMTAEQFEITKKLFSEDSVLPLASGYGDFFNKVVEITDELREGKPVGTTLTKFAPLLQNEIDDVLGFDD